MHRTAFQLSVFVVYKEKVDTISHTMEVLSQLEEEEDNLPVELDEPLENDVAEVLEDDEEEVTEE